MAFVILHYFEEENFYKLSYTNKTVEAYEACEIEKRWGDRAFTRVWVREFASAEEAKAFKSSKLRGVPRFTSTFLTKTDTFQGTPPDSEGDIEVAPVEGVWVYLLKFGDLYKCGYTSNWDSRECEWSFKVKTVESAKDFTYFVRRGSKSHPSAVPGIKVLFSTDRDMSKDALVKEYKEFRTEARK